MAIKILIVVLGFYLDGFSYYKRMGINGVGSIVGKIR